MNRVIVTAGASGIGLAVTQAVHAGGAHVCICDIDEAGLQRAAAEMPGLLIRRPEVGDRAQVTAMVADAAPRLGGIDVLVNNAGIGGPTASVQELDPDDGAALAVFLASDAAKSISGQLIPIDGDQQRA